MTALLRSQSRPVEAPPSQVPDGAALEEAVRYRVSADVDSFVTLLLADDGAFAAEGALLRARGELGSWARVAEFVGASLVEVGQRWSAGRLSILEEHMASARLGRALGRIAASIPVQSLAPRALLVTAPADDHTLSLALLELCLLEAGWRCRWAGRATPIEEVTAHVDTGEIELVVASASQHSSNAAALARWAETVGDACRRNSATLIVGGGGAWPEQIASGVRLRTFEQLSAYLAGRQARPQ